MQYRLTEANWSRCSTKAERQRKK